MSVVEWKAKNTKSNSKTNRQVEADIEAFAQSQRPKEIATRIENGKIVRVFEARPAAGYGAFRDIRWE